MSGSPACDSTTRRALRCWSVVSRRRSALIWRRLVYGMTVALLQAGDELVRRAQLRAHVVEEALRVSGLHDVGGDAGHLLAALFGRHARIDRRFTHRLAEMIHRLAEGD